MSEDYPENFRFTDQHEWILVEGDEAKVGITSFAQEQLGEIVFVELPSVGKTLKKGDVACVVESTKAASDVYSPVSGKVSATNNDLSETPELLNQQPHDKGWIIKLQGIDADEISALMDRNDYLSYIESVG